MEKVKKIIFSSWFKAALIGLCALILLFEKHVFYSGIAFGFALRELLEVFRNFKMETIVKEPLGKESKTEKDK
jgi:hypothetical protein